MKIEIQQTDNISNVLNVAYIVASGRKQNSGSLGVIHKVGEHYVFMVDNRPVNVINKLSEMDNIILNLFRVKPSYVNVLF